MLKPCCRVNHWSHTPNCDELAGHCLIAFGPLALCPNEVEKMTVDADVPVLPCWAIATIATWEEMDKIHSASCRGFYDPVISRVGFYTLVSLQDLRDGKTGQCMVIWCHVFRVGRLVKSGHWAKNYDVSKGYVCASPESSPWPTFQTYTTHIWLFV